MGVTYRVGVFGHVVMDYIVTVRHLPQRNTSIEILDRHRYFGGTAGNVARAAARLGIRTSLASFVGPDFPADYRRELAKDRVDLWDLRAVRGANTPTAWIFSDPRGNQMAVIDQAAMLRAPDQALQEHTVRNSSIVHLMTGQPRYYRKVAALAKRLARDLAIDPSQEIHYVYDAADLRSLLDGARYFFGNEAEVARAIKFLRLRSLRAFASRVPVVVETPAFRSELVLDWLRPAALASRLAPEVERARAGLAQGTSTRR